MHNKKFSATVAIFSAAIALFSAAIARAADTDLIISEILIGGNSADEEFIELYNPTSKDIDLKLLPLKLHIVSSTGADTSKTLTYTSPNSVIKTHDYFLLASPSFKEKHGDTTVSITYSAALVSNGAIYLSTSATKDFNVIDLVCWGTSAKCVFPLPDPRQNYSLERIGNGSDWQESCETGGSAGKEAKECEPVESSPAKIPPKAENSSNSSSTTNFTDATTSEKVFLNEILPNPEDGSDNEYIEIANGSVEPVDLFEWRIKDSSKSKGYQFKEHIILGPGEFFAIYRPDSKIALNNSNESIYLYNPKNEITSNVSFDKSIKNSSYNFDGKTWKWSKYLTPGKKNQFDSEPLVKITKPKHAYKDLQTEFNAKAKDKETKKLKYVWDFGDGKKSYLAKTSHKYLDTGKYTVTLSVSDDSQTVEKSFVINVKKNPRPNLEIVKIVPNPAGNDSEAEIVELKNNSNKQIDLSGWKISTGSGEKIFNHPIIGEISLGPGETKTITREFSKFSLNNKAGKVQLVMPDGKVIDEVEYSKDPPDSLRDSKRAGKIAEDEAYAKIDGEWLWVEPGAADEIADELGTGENNIATPDQSNDENADNGEVLGATDKNELPLSNYNSAFSSEDAFIFLSDIGLLKSQNKEINYCPLKDTTASLEYFLISSI